MLVHPTNLYKALSQTLRNAREVGNETTPFGGYQTQLISDLLPLCKLIGYTYEAVLNVHTFCTEAVHSGQLHDHFKSAGRPITLINGSAVSPMHRFSY